MNTRVDIKNQLIKRNDETKEKNNKILEEFGLNEVKGYIGYDSSRDLAILNALGENSVNKIVSAVQSKSIELEKAENYYGGRVFSKQEIKNLCITYKLKLLPSKFFIGNFEVEVLAQIKKLEKNIGIARNKELAAKRNISVEEFVSENGPDIFKFDTHELKTRFYVMAPPSMFQLKNRPKPEKIRDYDPILFYEDENKQLVMVHKWGKDFTILRAVKGFIFKNENTLFFTIFLTVSSILFLSLAQFSNIFINKTIGYNILAILGVLLISPLLSILIIPKAGSDVYSEHGWNTEFKS